PPELEATCVKACAVDAERRHGSVRELIAEIERYLEGERDQTLRRQLAQEHADKARQAVAKIDDPIEARRVAMAEVGRSLALDQNNRDAFQVLFETMQSPPPVVPEEVKADLRKAEYERGKRAALSESRGYLLLV